MKNIKRRFFIKSSSLIAGGLVLPSFKIERIIHPDPAPMSKILNFDLFCVNFNTCSTMISVSGLGI